MDSCRKWGIDMSAGKERIIICADCGIEFPTKYSRTLVCKECAAKRQIIYEQRRNEKKRMQRAVDPERAEIHLCDSPEKIQKCLNCTKEDCNNCLGWASNATKYKRGPNYTEGKDKFLACLKNGMKATEAAKKVGISKNSAYTWEKRLKKEGLL